MFTSLTQTNRASEYRNSPSRSSVFNDGSINDGGSFVYGILAGVEVILVKSNSEDTEQITSAYADRHTDTLSNGDKCDPLFASKKTRSIIPIAFVVTAQVLKVRQRANNSIAID